MGKRSNATQSIWIEHGKQSIVSVRIPSLTLHGTRTASNSQSLRKRLTRKLFGRRHDLSTTIFNIEVRFERLRYTVKRSFSELRELYLYLHSPSFGQAANVSKYLTKPFPSGDEGEDDTMVLLERKDIAEHFLMECVDSMNILFFSPLSNFLEFPSFITPLLSHIIRIQALARKYIIKRSLPQILLKVHSRKVSELLLVLENGIEVLEISERADFYNCSGTRAIYGYNASDNEGTEDSQSLVHRRILWLDMSDNLSTCRLCLSSKQIFELPRDHADQRLVTGLFLSDVAEIRSGAKSIGFLNALNMEGGSYVFSNKDFDSSRCLSIIGAERVFDICLLPSYDLKSDCLLPNYFTRLLRLISINSLPTEDLELRQVKLEITQPKVAPVALLAKSEWLEGLLKPPGIPVDEETLEVSSSGGGLKLLSRILSYQSSLNCFVVESANSTTKLYISIDDISEIRPGKLSAALDEGQDSWAISIVSSDSVLVLPLLSSTVRDRFLDHLQAFVRVHKTKNLTLPLLSNIRMILSENRKGFFSPDDLKILAQDISTRRNSTLRDSNGSVHRISFEKRNSGSHQDQSVQFSNARTLLVPELCSNESEASYDFRMTRSGIIPGTGSSSIITRTFNNSSDKTHSRNSNVKLSFEFEKNPETLSFLE